MSRAHLGSLGSYVAHYGSVGIICQEGHHKGANHGIFAILVNFKSSDILTLLKPNWPGLFQSLLAG